MDRETLFALAVVAALSFLGGSLASAEPLTLTRARITLFMNTILMLGTKVMLLVFISSPVRQR